MKKLILLLMIISFISCTEDDSVESIQYQIILKNTCDDSDSTIYSDYCVTATTYNDVKQQRENSSDNCTQVSFTDLNGNEVQGIFRASAYSETQCDDGLPSNFR